jgi:hypothetical protein
MEKKETKYYIRHNGFKIEDPAETYYLLVNKVLKTLQWSITQKFTYSGVIFETSQGHKLFIPEGKRPEKGYVIYDKEVYLYFPITILDRGWFYMRFFKESEAINNIPIVCLKITLPYKVGDDFFDICEWDDMDSPCIPPAC